MEAVRCESEDRRSDSGNKRNRAKPEKGATVRVGQLPIMAADKTKPGRGWGTRGVRLMLADLSTVGLRQRQHLDRT